MRVDIYLKGRRDESYSTRENHHPSNRMVDGSFHLQESTRLVKFSTVDGSRVTIPLESIEQIIQKSRKPDGDN